MTNSSIPAKIAPRSAVETREHTAAEHFGREDSFDRALQQAAERKSSRSTAERSKSRTPKADQDRSETTREAEDRRTGSEAATTVRSKRVAVRRESGTENSSVAEPSPADSEAANTDVLNVDLTDAAVDTNTDGNVDNAQDAPVVDVSVMPLEQQQLATLERLSAQATSNVSVVIGSDDGAETIVLAQDLPQGESLADGRLLPMATGEPIMTSLSEVNSNPEDVVKSVAADLSASVALKQTNSEQSGVAVTGTMPLSLSLRGTRAIGVTDVDGPTGTAPRIGEVNVDGADEISSMPRGSLVDGTSSTDVRQAPVAANADSVVSTLSSSGGMSATAVAAVDSAVIGSDSSGQVNALEPSMLSATEAAELAALDEDGSADSVMRQVKRAIGAIRNTAGGDHEFKIRLVPRELGSVTIGIQTSEAGIAIGLVTETSAASDRLNEQRQQLMDELSESGVDSSSVDISHEGQSQGQFGQHDGTEESGNARGSANTARPSLASEPTAPAVGANRRLGASGRVDVAL